MLSRLYRGISIKTIHVYLMIGLLAGMLTSCGDRLTATNIPNPQTPNLPVVSGKLSEVAPPPLIQELRSRLDRYAPQVVILEPQPDRVFADTLVKVELQVTDLPLFKAPDLELGPHLDLILDNEPARAIHDLTEPVILENLTPGTHTLRVFASRPWHESFKNDGAYAQTTFHVITKTGNNAPDPNQPLLTYSRPQGTYGTEPILLDFYLSNAPLHLVATENAADNINDWRIRVTVNGESFLLDRWEPIYLKGFEKGDNWIELEFIDTQGNKVDNAFNTTVRQIKFDPSHEDTLTQLTRGDLSPEVARSIIDPNYKATPVIEEETPIIEEETPVVEETPIIEEETPVVEETPIIEEETPVVEETPIIEETPVIIEETPVIIEEIPVVKVEETPVIIEESPYL